MIFVDTNYFVRFFLKDVPRQFDEAEKLFLLGAREKEILITSTIVFFEIYWLFKSFYGKTKPEIIEILHKLLNMKFIVLEEKWILEEALVIFSRVSLDLEDCYYLAFMKSQKIKNLKTFDHKLQREFLKGN